MDFYHFVDGKWFTSRSLAARPQTMAEYREIVRSAYGNLTGVRFASSETSDYGYVGETLTVTRRS